MKRPSNEVCAHVLRSSAEEDSAGVNAALDLQVLARDGQHGERMLNAVYEFLGRFVSYPSEHARVAHTLWVAHTHMMDIWDSTPRLAFLSAEPASGKTRALEVTELLVPNPVATVNVSPAYLFRKVGAGGATILYDEVDTVFGPKAKENEDIRGLLNAGHRRGATTGRCILRGNDVLFEELPAYSAVALAGIGWLPDTILSRSVIIRMRRRHTGETVEAFRRRLHEVAGWAIRDEVAGWASSAKNTFSWPLLPPEIVDRDADVWEPLLAVADMAGDAWPERARAAGVALVADAKEVELSLGIRLLNDLRTVFGSAKEMSSKAILEALHGLEEAPWSDIRGKPLDVRSLGHRLRQYGVKSKTIRTANGTPKGYTKSDLTDLWTRYLPALPATSATSATSATEDATTQRDAEDGTNVVAVVADVALPPAGARVCAHCAQRGGLFCDASVNGASISLHVHCKDDFKFGH